VKPAPAKVAPVAKPASKVPMLPTPHDAVDPDHADAH